MCQALVWALRIQRWTVVKPPLSRASVMVGFLGGCSEELAGKVFVGGQEPRQHRLSQ